MLLYCYLYITIEEKDFQLANCTVSSSISFPLHTDSCKVYKKLNISVFFLFVFFQPVIFAQGFYVNLKSVLKSVCSFCKCISGLAVVVFFCWVSDHRDRCPFVGKLNDPYRALGLLSRWPVDMTPGDIPKNIHNCAFQQRKHLLKRGIRS